MVTSKKSLFLIISLFSRFLSAEDVLKIKKEIDLKKEKISLIIVENIFGDVYLRDSKGADKVELYTTIQNLSLDKGLALEVLLEKKENVAIFKIIRHDKGFSTEKDRKEDRSRADITVLSPSVDLVILTEKGKIDIKGVRGEIYLYSKHGRIEVKRVKELTVLNRYGLTRVVAPKGSSAFFSSVTGKVDIVMPDEGVCILGATSGSVASDIGAFFLERPFKEPNKIFPLFISDSKECGYFGLFSRRGDIRIRIYAEVKR